jgi:hypothetical protein
VQGVKAVTNVNITTNMEVIARCKGTRATCAKAIVKHEGTIRHKINNMVQNAKQNMKPTKKN